MAIYQFNLTAIPRKSILEKYGKIPDMLKVDYEERKEHYNKSKEGTINELDIFTDALTQDWWSKIEIDISKLVARIDNYVNRADWGNDEFSFNWKTYSDKVDNDANLSLNEENGKIEELNFRADLRENELTFLKNMILLARDNDWLLMDVKGNLSEPQIEEVKKIIKISNCYRFLTNPEKFFDDLESGKIKIE